ncbi:MAG: L-2-amino-thiazoline-4-carboxylic acid hydrolase [Limnochordia bacterium]|jgi:hypothetical protein
MNERESIEYYLSRMPEIVAMLESHARTWRPFLTAAYGGPFAEGVIGESQERSKALIPTLPYIGGDHNPMTRHLLRSTASLVLYQAMKARGRTAEETGKILYEAVTASVGRLPCRDFELTAEYVASEKARARRSQERPYPGDWVWEFVEGDGEAFDFGCDFLECGTQKLYLSHGAQEFLPYYCYLDFATHRMSGWGFARSMTLAEGYPRCDFRWKRGGETEKGWPPPSVPVDPEDKRTEASTMRWIALTSPLAPGCLLHRVG